MTLRALLSILAACLSLCAGSVTTATAATVPKKTLSPSHGGDAAKDPAAATGGAPKKSGSGMPLLPGSGSKEPINIHADQLDFLNKENKLIYTGHVVAVQGDSTLKASKLTIDLDRTGSGGGAPDAAADGTPGDGGSSVRHMDAEGPVTMISKDQIGTGSHATYDKAENKVHLTGSVTLSQCANVTQGDSLVYDLQSGQARVMGNVGSVFTPGSDKQGDASKCQTGKASAP